MTDQTSKAKNNYSWHNQHFFSRELRQLTRKDAVFALADVKRLEKKSFPSNEAFPFDDVLLKKPNSSILVLTEQESVISPVIAYAVWVRWNSTFLLHKICVAPEWRGRRIGRFLMEKILSRAEESGCRIVELWVDESREIARRLYASCGFVETGFKENYYSPGRSGIKMSLHIPG